MPQTTGGYTWDKIVTGSGVTGYVARGSANENYIEVVNTGNSGETTNAETNKTSKINGNNLITIPSIKLSDLKKDYTEIVIKKDGKNIGENDKIGTGFTATYNGKTYTIVVAGDTSGDGEINSMDLLKVQKHLLGTKKLEGSYQSAADVNGDGKINSLDLLKIQKYLLNGSKITI